MFFVEKYRLYHSRSMATSTFYTTATLIWMLWGQTLSISDFTLTIIINKSLFKFWYVILYKVATSLRSSYSHRYRFLLIFLISSLKDDFLFPCGWFIFRGKHLKRLFVHKTCLEYLSGERLNFIRYILYQYFIFWNNKKSSKKIQMVKHFSKRSLPV